jgi:cellulose biosynthesis protein BcsQ
MGEIITFYSYKGGTGRTMALANVGWLLASAGKKVLLVDWDLEAPGLHRYLHPFLLDKELIASRGIIDVVMDFSIQAMTPAAGGEGSDWYKKYADILRCALSLNWSEFGEGRLDLLPAGQQTATYATRVNSFSWDNFYERLGGGTFLEAVKASMKKEYDYVLVDSRTGVSDTSGICTVQLPDKVVICFTLNRQSIQGAAAVAESIVQARAKEPKLPPLEIFPVPTRVERAEHVRLEAARTAARDLFSNFLGGWDEVKRRAYWKEIEVFYQPYYAYEEVPATFGEERAEIGSMLYSMERLAGYLTGVSGWKMPSAQQRDIVLGQYLRVKPVGPGVEVSPALLDQIMPVAEAAPSASPSLSPPPPAPVLEWRHQPHHGALPMLPPPSPMPRLRDEDTESRRHWFFLSYADGEDLSKITILRDDLDQQLRAFIGLAATGESLGWVVPVAGDPVWPPGRRRALQSSRMVVCLISPRYLQSEQAGREFTLLHPSIPVLPVMWERVTTIPPALAQLQFFQGPQLLERGLRHIMRVSRFRSDYHSCVLEMARKIADLGSIPKPMIRLPESLAGVPNAFVHTAEPASEVLFVCAVPSWAQAGSAGLTADLYGETAGSWRPWGGRSLDEILTSVAQQAQLRSRLIPADRSALEQVQQSEHEGQISLGLVDPNALKVPGLRVKELRPIQRIGIITEPGSVFEGLEAHSEEQLVSVVREELEKLRVAAINRAVERRGFGDTALLS